VAAMGVAPVGTLAQAEVQEEREAAQELVRAELGAPPQAEVVPEQAEVRERRLGAVRALRTMAGFPKSGQARAKNREPVPSVTTTIGIVRVRMQSLFRSVLRAPALAAHVKVFNSWTLGAVLIAWERAFQSSCIVSGTPLGETAPLRVQIVV
jgi:hypothetical protein